jgi:hypothetical protein
MELQRSSEYLPGYASIPIGLDAPLMPLAFAGLQGFRVPGPWNSQSFSRFPLMNFRSPSENSQVPSGRLSACDYSLAPATAPSLEFAPLQRFPTWSSGMIGRPCLARPPASSGFLNLLTPSSAPRLPALFHAGSAHGVRPTKLSSSRAACAPSPVPLPSCRSRRSRTSPAVGHVASTEVPRHNPLP